MATILIANADTRYVQMLAKVLTAYHHEVVTARTGEEALQLCDVRQPAVVLLDLGILGMPGLRVLAKILAQAPTLSIVTLSGEVPIEDENRARELGVTDVLRKRLKMDVIMQVVNHVLQQRGRAHFQPVTVGPGSESPREGAPPRVAKILIVDDEPDIGAVVGEFLQRHGYETRVASTGQEALDLMGKERPDLVLLDIYMPGMNGVEVLRRITEPAFPVQPPPGVIMLTASQDEPLLQHALDHGAFDVLLKPVNLDQIELAVIVKLAIGNSERVNEFGTLAVSI